MSKLMSDFVDTMTKKIHHIRTASNCEEFDMAEDLVKKMADYVVEFRQRWEGTWECPECGSIAVEEISYKDDFGSQKCLDCGYQGDPGEEFKWSTNES